VTTVPIGDHIADRFASSRHLMKRPWVVGIVICALVICVQIILKTLGLASNFPSRFDTVLSDPINDINGWLQDHRKTSPLFTAFLNPFSDGIEGALNAVESLLRWIPWFCLPLIGMILVARRDKVRRTVCTGLALLYPALVGLWEPSLDTIALVLVSVGVSLLIGIPLGVAAGVFPRVDRFTRPILDGMQTIPSTVFLLPSVLLLGIGTVPAAFATVIYALPPVVRLTSLGIKEVPAAMVEAGTMFGSSRRQLLTKVQLPNAVPSILTGINQTINMALGLVVIASLVGGGGLGQSVQSSLQVRSPGRGLVAGAALVAIALALDRITRSFIERAGQVGNTPLLHRLSIIAGLLAAIGIGKALGWTNVPFSFDASVVNPIDDGFIWLRDHVSDVTRWINDTVVRQLLVRGVKLLSITILWPVLVALTATVAYLARGWKLAVFAVIGLCSVGLVGMWNTSIETLVQSVVAVLISGLIAIPVGIWAGRNARVERLLSPILDALQTVPPLIYTIPFVMLFTVSPVPGIIASVLYAIPAGIRIAALGIQQVDHAPLEASTSFGATRSQTLWGINVPLALPTIVLAINQVIMMVLAMVIIAGMVGGGGLGFKAVEALTRSNSGLGIEVGLSIVVMAIIFDRTLQGIADRLKPVQPN
jgi:glycine betaine/proline transport system permease protein